EDKGKRIILVTVSTLSVGDADFLRRVVEAVAEEDDWKVILGLGGKLKANDLTVSGFSSAGAGEKPGQGAGENLPANVHAFSYVPQLKVLAVADLSINHGGIHTIHECLHFGVPMLVYSGKRSDQPGCAARVHYHGVGLMADKDLDPPEVIRQKIAEVMAGGYDAGMRQMQQYTNRYRTERVLEHTIADLLAKVPTQP
ncbi:MAG: nucleotide disphospho-sugar-binding domain-containing protein, partial [Bacteroidota bacterium]